MTVLDILTKEDGGTRKGGVRLVRDHKVNG